MFVFSGVDTTMATTGPMNHLTTGVLGPLKGGEREIVKPLKAKISGPTARCQLVGG